MKEQTIVLLRELQDGFKLETRPFKRIANKLGCTEDQVLQSINQCVEEGTIRRIGAAIRPEKLGHTCNALVVWEVSEEIIDSVGEGVAAMREVSHCYDRECPSGWVYNFFTMIHAKSEDELEELIKKIAQEHGLTNYKIYETGQELKKTSMRYFAEDED